MEKLAPLVNEIKLGKQRKGSLQQALTDDSALEAEGRMPIKSANYSSFYASYNRYYFTYIFCYTKKYANSNTFAEYPHGFDI